MAQEKLRQQQVKELEEKEQELENIKAATQKKVFHCAFNFDARHSLTRGQMPTKNYTVCES
jgi:hypothetical protein